MLDVLQQGGVEEGGRVEAAIELQHRERLYQRILNGDQKRLAGLKMAWWAKPNKHSHTAERG